MTCTVLIIQIIIIPLPGAGMYVTTAVAGGVVLLRPFVLTKRPFLRDNIFYVFAVYWALFILWNNQINIGEAIGIPLYHYYNYICFITFQGFLVYYFFYVVIVVFGALIYQKWANRKLNLLKRGQEYSEQTRSQFLYYWCIMKCRCYKIVLMQ